MTTPPFIELKNISYCYSEHSPPVFHNIHLSLSDEKIGLIGSNGGGKTTLLHIVMGLLQPTTGVVCFHGKPLREPGDFKELRKEVGFLFQNSDDQLFSPTVLEDVAFGPLNLGIPPEEARHIAISTLERLGLNDFEDRITHKLSGGEKKLVALATILAMDPQYLLLDEPTNNLDPNTRGRLITILQSLGLPLVIISHDWDFLSETTTTLYSLENGHLYLCQEGHIHEHRHIHPYGHRPHRHGD